MTESLARSYSECRQIARSRARNFYYSFLLLPARQRDALCAVYSFMRRCDDIADGDVECPDKAEELARWRELALVSPDLRDVGDGSILPAFRDALGRFSIPERYFFEIVDGVELDLWKNRYETFKELYGYCYKVASAVGLVCLYIFGFEGDEALERAEHCGIAFQLTNILRDLKEDSERGRIYLPQEELRRFGYSEEELLGGVRNRNFRELMAFQTARARSYYDSALPLLRMVPRRSRSALSSMMSVYRRILDEIEARDFDVFAERVSLSAGQKTRIILRSLVKPGAPHA